VMMRYVDHFAKDSFLGPGAMFLFAGAIQVLAVRFACALPKDETNSKKRDSSESLHSPGRSLKKDVDSYGTLTLSETSLLNDSFDLA
jgi:hypothetical protein